MSVSGLGDEEKRLIEELQQLAKQGQGWSEYDTCDAIILRALREIGGYRYGDYRAQQSTTAGYPDFTVLPDTEYTWYLEAKALRVDLNDDHVVQALNYANATGRRWVVLSNGREWRLYDQYIPAKPSEKLVAQALLDNTPEIVQFLRAIGKESVKHGQVEVFARRQRVKRVLDRQLKESGSEIIRAIVDELHALGLNDVTGDDVVAYFNPPIVDNNGPVYSMDDLARRAKELTKWKKPLYVEFPDKTVKDVHTWRNLVFAVLQWFGHRLPPAPQPRRKGSKARYFYNSEPRHKNVPMTSPKPFEVAGRQLYLEGFLDSSEYLESLVYLCECIGEPPSGFRIRLRE